MLLFVVVVVVAVFVVVVVLAVAEKLRQGLSPGAAEWRAEDGLR